MTTKILYPFDYARVSRGASQFDGASWNDLVTGEATYIADTGSYMNAYGLQAAEEPVDTWRIIQRGIFLFNGESLTSNFSISSAILSVDVFDRETGGWNDQCKLFSVGAGPEIDISDYIYTKWGTTPLSDVISWQDTGRTEISLNAAGIATITNGLFALGFREVNYDLANSAPPWSANHTEKVIINSPDSSESYRPYLSLEYTAYPTTTTEDRVTGIVHYVSPGDGRPNSAVYLNELILGGLDTRFFIDYMKKPIPAVPGEVKEEGGERIYLGRWTEYTETGMRFYDSYLEYIEGVWKEVRYYITDYPHGIMG